MQFSFPLSFYNCSDPNQLSVHFPLIPFVRPPLSLFCLPFCTQRIHPFIHPHTPPPSAHPQEPGYGTDDSGAHPHSSSMVDDLGNSRHFRTTTANATGSGSDHPYPYPAKTHKTGPSPSCASGSRTASNSRYIAYQTCMIHHRYTHIHTYAHSQVRVHIQLLLFQLQ
jgi:hypothetical protein